MKQKTKKGRTTHYSPNLVYILSIDNSQFYVGCHTYSSKDYLTGKDIIRTSGNYLRYKVIRGEISYQEYYDRTKLLKVYECTSKEEAQDLEVELIKEYKENYGDACVNISYGNKLFNKGIKRSPEYLKKMSESRIGHFVSNETRKKISKANTGRPSTRRKKVQDIYTGKIYNTVKECCDENNLQYTSFKRMVDSGSKKYHYRFI